MDLVACFLPAGRPTVQVQSAIQQLTEHSPISYSHFIQLVGRVEIFLGKGNGVTAQSTAEHTKLQHSVQGG